MPEATALRIDDVAEAMAASNLAQESDAIDFDFAESVIEKRERLPTLRRAVARLATVAALTAAAAGAGGLFTAANAAAKAPPPAELGFDAAGQYPNIYNDANFNALLTGMGQQTHSSVKYIRMGIPWSTFGTRTWSYYHGKPTQNGPTDHCVTPSSYAYYQQGIESTVYDTIRQRKTPFLVFSAAGPPKSSYGANADTPNWPTDLDLQCGVQKALLRLKIGAGGKAHFVIETMNEPEWDQGGATGAGSLPGNACTRFAGRTTLDPADCAARYFADVRLGTNRILGPNTKVLAGVFMRTAPEDTSGTQPCTKRSNGFPARYMCYLANGDRDDHNPPKLPGGRTLKSFGHSAVSWSFHDYDDVIRDAQNGCQPGAAKWKCSLRDAQSMKKVLKHFGFPASDVWDTESGSAHVFGIGANSEQTFDARATYTWQTIARYGGLRSVFWYQYWKGDDWFDSSLVDGDYPTSSTSRSPAKFDPGYCVLAQGWNARGNCTG